MALNVGEVAEYRFGVLAIWSSLFEGIGFNDIIERILAWIVIGVRDARIKMR